VLNVFCSCPGARCFIPGCLMRLGIVHFLRYVALLFSEHCHVPPQEHATSSWQNSKVISSSDSQQAGLPMIHSAGTFRPLSCSPVSPSPSAPDISLLETSPVRGESPGGAAGGMSYHCAFRDPELLRAAPHRSLDKWVYHGEQIGVTQDRYQPARWKKRPCSGQSHSAIR